MHNTWRKSAETARRVSRNAGNGARKCWLNAKSKGKKFNVNLDEVYEKMQSSRGYMMLRSALLPVGVFGGYTMYLNHKREQLVVEKHGATMEHHNELIGRIKANAEGNAQIMEMFDSWIHTIGVSTAAPPPAAAAAPPSQ